MDRPTPKPLPEYGLRAWATELRRYGWIHPIIALAVTIAMGLDLLVTEVAFCAVGLVVTGLYACVANRLLDAQRSPLSRALLHAATFVAGLAIGGELARLILARLVDAAALTDLRASFWRIGASLGALTMVLAAVFDRVRTRADVLEITAARAERERLRAQLLAAQARMHPHFLFNSLNTLADLIEVDPPAAVDATERLASLLRYALEGERQPAVPLARELEVIADYVALEQLRFGDRLRFTADVDPAALDLPVPPFILQPVVENAVKHGVAGSRSGAAVRLSARVIPADPPKPGRLLELLVVDDGPGTSASSGTHVGEADLRLRLRLLYGARATLQCTPLPDGGYHVRITLDPHALEVGA